MPATVIDDDRIKQRFTVLTWAVGISAALTIATLGMVVSMSYQLGHIAGALDVVVAHVVLK
jgi:heme A synthase